MKLTDIKIKFNLKSVLLFEKDADKSFLDINSVEDTLLYIFYLIKTNNDFNYSYQTFLSMLELKKDFQSLILKESKKIFDDVRNCFKKTDDTDDKTSSNEKPEKITPLIIKIATKLDVNYVMYDMDLFELQLFINELSNEKKETLELDRLWTFINVSPHIDSKKLKSPKDLLPFAWEKPEENKIDITKNKDFILAMLGKNIKKEEITENE